MAHSYVNTGSDALSEPVQVSAGVNTVPMTFAEQGIDATVSLAVAGVNTDAPALMIDAGVGPDSLLSTTDITHANPISVVQYEAGNEIDYLVEISDDLINLHSKGITPKLAHFTAVEVLESVSFADDLGIIEISFFDDSEEISLAIAEAFAYLGLA